jgi:pimeloyl-ACP methyl ester carboxylesterase
MLGKTDFRGRLSKRPAHVTLMGGSADRATPPATLNALAGELGGLPVKIIDRAGHVPSIEQPEVLLKLIRAAASR